MAAFSIIGREGSVPVHVWAKTLDDKSREQLLNTASLPFVFHHVAAMPDVHAGLGATIGSVIATEGAVIPSAVGVDIGCGMRLARLNFRRGDLDDRAVRAVYEAILRHVPVGMTERRPDAVRHDRTEPFEEGMKSLLDRHPELLERMVSMTWQSQLGSLGAGNHFIELTSDADGVVRVMLHSGSRGVGNVMASRFIGIAREKALGGKVRLPDPALAWFDEGTDDFNDYMDAVNWAQAYAKINREIMMEDVMAAVREVMPGAEISSDEPVVDCHHNYVARETHYGRDVWVTRKGAVHAGRGELGIIPGSMGAASYLVEGLGSEESFMSSAHGAGRTMSRTQAKKVFTVADLKREKVDFIFQFFHVITGCRQSYIQHNIIEIVIACFRIVIFESIRINRISDLYIIRFFIRVISFFNTVTVSRKYKFGFTRVTIGSTLLQSFICQPIKRTPFPLIFTIRCLIRYFTNNIIRYF